MTIAIKFAQKNQVQNLKKHLSARGLPVCGAKCILIECLNKALNDKVVAKISEKIVSLLPVPKPTNSARSDGDRGASQGEDVCVESV